MSGSVTPWPNTDDDRVATTRHKGLMPKFVAPLTSSGGSSPTLSIAAATTSAAGSLSAADKSKLDNLARPIIRLNVNQAADLLTGGALVANTWTNLGAAQAFALTSGTSVYDLRVRLGAWANFAGSSYFLGLGAVLNGTRIVLAGGVANAGVGPFPPHASLVGSGLLTSNTLQLQIISNVAAAVFLRPTTAPNFELLGIQVTEVAP